jgi:crossover junction endodeoxyribonuclease RusA
VTPRTWRVEFPAGIPLLNANRRQHWAVKARITRDLRQVAFVCARRDRVPALSRAHIVVEYCPPDRRRRDVHNLFPSAKAAVDGLVDAGVLPDDSDTYLTGPDMRLGQVIADGCLVIHITEQEAA